MTSKIENYQDEIEKLAMKRRDRSFSSEGEEETLKSESFDEKDSFMNCKNDYDSLGKFKY